MRKSNLNERKPGNKMIERIKETGPDFRIQRGVCLIACFLFFSPEIYSDPVENTRSYINEVKKAPSQIEIAGLPNGCSEDRLTTFRQNGKILRVQYGTHDSCATEKSFQLEQFFTSEGLPVYAVFRDCPGMQNECIAGQLYFSEQKAALTENYKIIIQPDGYGQHIKKVSSIGNCISACIETDINRPGGKSCYFASSSDVERYLKKRLENKNLEGMFATVTAGRFSEYLLSSPVQWKAVINANQVRLRKEPSMDSPILEYLFPFESAVVIEKGIKEEIAPWGTYHWLRLKTGSKTGWIFGAFLDPVLDEGMLENAQITRWLPSLSGESPRRFTYSPSFRPERVVCSASEIDTSVTCTLRLTYAAAAKTNLNEAYLLISSGPLNRSCEMEDFRDGFPLSEEKTITDIGVEYSVAEGEEGGMSKFYYKKVYLTQYDHRCRAVIYFYHTTTRAVYENGSELPEFDTTKAKAEFDRIRRSIVWEYRNNK